MKFCDKHWTMVREACNSRGLGDLAAHDGEEAERRTRVSLERQETEPSLDTFDPYLGSMWAICNNTITMIAQTGNNPLALMQEEGATVVGKDGRDMGPYKCPLCYLNETHIEFCSDPDCKIDPIVQMDWMVDKAADDAVEQAKKLGLR